MAISDVESRERAVTIAMASAEGVMLAFDGHQ
jgi:hypothetical protein